MKYQSPEPCTYNVVIMDAVRWRCQAMKCPPHRLYRYRLTLGLPRCVVHTSMFILSATLLRVSIAASAATPQSRSREESSPGAVTGVGGTNNLIVSEYFAGGNYVSIHSRRFPLLLPMAVTPVFGCHATRWSLQLVAGEGEWRP